MKAPTSGCYESNIAIALHCVCRWGWSSDSISSDIHHPRDLALTNQNEVVGLLRQAKPLLASRGPTEIKGAILGNRIMLQPGRSRVTSGHSLRLAVGPSSFTVSAEPLIPGKTGVYSFLRDASANIRFELVLGKTATEHSRLWNR
jgi:hypothetical protein